MREPMKFIKNIMLIFLSVVGLGSAFALFSFPIAVVLWLCHVANFVTSVKLAACFGVSVFGWRLYNIIWDWWTGS